KKALPSASGGNPAPATLDQQHLLAIENIVTTPYDCPSSTGMSLSKHAGDPTGRPTVNGQVRGSPAGVSDGSRGHRTFLGCERACSAGSSDPFDLSPDRADGLRLPEARVHQVGVGDRVQRVWSSAGQRR